MSKKLSLILLVVLIVLLGFLRDYLFLNINWIYLNLTTGRPNQALREFHFLLNWEVASIEKLKWFLTVLFTLLFLLNTWLVIHLAFKKKFFNLITLGLFGLLFAVSGVLYLVAYFSDSMRDLYGIIRTLMGMAQSFMPLMILFVLFKFLPVQNQKNT